MPLYAYDIYSGFVADAIGIVGSKDVTRLVTKGMKANHVVTKFTLKRAQNSTGINYSQVICAVDRPLSPEEKKNIAAMTEQVKLIAGKVSVVETETETVVE